MIRIATLRAAGLSAEQIVKVVETDQEERLLARREQIRQATQRYRARKNIQQNQHSCDHGEHHTDHTPSPSFSPSDGFPTPLPITPPLTPPSPSFAQQALRADGWPKDFQDQFWKAYPRHVGKKHAMRKLETVRKSGECSFSKLMAAVGRIEASEPRFIPHPGTWLNQGRYLDGDFGEETNGLSDKEYRAAQEILARTRNGGTHG
jgi:hypothetical protein